MGKRIIPGSHRSLTKGKILCSFIKFSQLILQAIMKISLENFYVENYPAERISLDKGKV